jgi:hypothetical protein
MLIFKFCIEMLIYFDAYLLTGLKAPCYLYLHEGHNVKRLILTPILKNEGKIYTVAPPADHPPSSS